MQWHKLTGHLWVCFSALCLDFGCSATGLPAQVGLWAVYCPLSIGPHQRATGPQTQGLHVGERKINTRLHLDPCVHLYIYVVPNETRDSLFIDGNTLYPKKQFHSSPWWVCLHLSGTTPPQYLTVQKYIWDMMTILDTSWSHPLA